MLNVYIQLPYQSRNLIEPGVLTGVGKRKKLRRVADPWFNTHFENPDDWSPVTSSGTFKTAVGKQRTSGRNGAEDRCYHVAILKLTMTSRFNRCNLFPLSGNY
jgi:hypothetical protein